MATSGSINFSLNRNEAINEALELIGVKDPEETAESVNVESAGRSLNMFLKTLQTKVHLPLIQKTFLFLQKNVNEYSLSSTGDHFTASFNKTTTSAASTSGTNTITVTSTTGILDTYNIGVELDDGTLQWTTVNGAPVGSVVTLTANLTDDVSSGATVYVYQTKANRPLRIADAVVRNSSDVDVPIDVYSRQEYVYQPNKTSDGQVTEIYYDPQKSTGKLFVWPETNTVDDYLVLWVHRTIEDMDSSTDDFDLPQEWHETIVYGLAKRIRSKFGVPIKQIADVIAYANELEEDLLGWDTETSSVFFGAE